MYVCTFTEKLASKYFTYVMYNLLPIFRPKMLTTYSRNNRQLYYSKQLSHALPFTFFRFSVNWKKAW